MAFPWPGWRWLIVPGIAGLLVALRGQHGTRARAIGFLHGMTAYALSLSWLFQIFGGLVVILWCVLAAFNALFAHMQGQAALRGVDGWKFAIFTTLNWCGWEFIRAELFPLKFPWMTAGLAVGPNVLLPWIGVYAVGALVVLAAALAVTRFWKFSAIPVSILIAAVLLTPSGSIPVEGDPGAVKVAGLQYENVTMETFLTETKKLSPGVQHVVWPEYSIPYDIRASKTEWEEVQALCRDRGITLTFGTQSRPDNGEVWRNIALTLDQAGVRGEHVKVHPVHFFNDGLAGKTAIPVQTDRGKVGTPICFDCDYEGVVREMTAAGAEMFVVPSMDAESWTARQHEQHAELFRIRACENGRWILVCATSGVSQIIDPNGRVHERLAALEQGSITGTIRRETGLTFYTRFGWLTPWVILAAAAACWILLCLPRKSLDKRPA